MIFLRWGWLERRLRVGSLRMRMYMYAIGMLVDFTLYQMFAMRKRQSSLPYPTHSRQCYKTQFNSVYYDSLRATRAFISFLIFPSRPRTHAGLEFMGKRRRKKRRENGRFKTSYKTSSALRLNTGTRDQQRTTRNYQYITDTPCWR